MKVFLCGMLLFSFMTSKSQSIDRCTAINNFLSNDSVRNMLSFDNNRVSFFCDKENGAGGCAVGYPGNHSFQWVSDSATAKPLKRGNCAYYFVSCIPKGRGWSVEISQGCSKLTCQGTVYKTNKKIFTATILAFVK